MPENDNKYYIRKADGGVNPSIKGSPTHAHLTVLSNCVGWVVGRSMEILQTETPVFAQYNAEDFYSTTKLEKGQVPKNGSIACWSQGKTWNGNDGAGHVAVVEKVISDTEIITSESAYGGMSFYTKTRKKGSGNWGAGSNFKFLGFIYLPEECVPEDETGGEYQLTVKGITNKAVAEDLLKYVKDCGFEGEIKEIKPEPPTEQPAEQPTEQTLKVGDKVKLRQGAKDLNTKGGFAAWVYNSTLYVREISGDRVIISTQKSGAVTGAVSKADLVKV